jgi:hypothetical protein
LTRKFLPALRTESGDGFSVTGGKEVSAMIGYDLVRTIITDVQEVMIKPITKSEHGSKCQRMIRIRTMQGETFELVLQSDQELRIHIHKNPWYGWLKPKVYKPQK